MAYMRAQIIEFSGYEVETNIGTEFIDYIELSDEELARIAVTGRPESLQDNTEGSEIYNVENVRGYDAYMSAPGYADRTEHCVFPTIEEAAQYLLDYYFDMPEEDMDEEEITDMEWLQDLVNNKEDLADV